MFPQWIADAVRPRSSVAVRTARRRFSLLLEPLEERNLLATSSGLGSTTAEQFVTGLYTQMLHRQPQASEIENWALQLDNGANVAQIARSFVDTPEYVVNEVVPAYQQYLGRTPDLAGLNAWVADFQTGMSYSSFLSGLLASPEYIQDQGGLGAGWVSSLYSGVLGRSADPSGLANWQTAISQGMAPGQITQDFVGSVEALDNQVTAGYQAFLGRGPDSNGLAQWVLLRQAGLSQEQLTVQLASSAEFVAKQASVTPPSFGVGASPAAPGVTLTVPPFSAVSNPTVSVDLNPSSASSQVFIDVDVKHDGSFSDAGQTTGTITAQNHQIALNALPNGTYSIRARVGQLTSPTVSVSINTNQGFVGATDLLNLYHDYASALVAGSIPANFYQAHKENFLYGGVGINVHTTEPQFLSGMAADLTNLGMAQAQIYASQQMVQGFLPISLLPMLTTLPNFASVTPIYRPNVNTGSVDTQGDPVIQAQQFRASQGVDGTGQTVGVISNSADLFNGGLGASERTGDLIPSHVKDLKDLPPGTASDDEGRAMMEIVADIAPGSNQYFYTGTVSAQDFANGITTLAANGASAIVDDLTYFDEPMFNDGVIAQAVDTVHNQGVFFATSANNSGQVAFSTPWKSVTASVDGVAGTYLDLGNENVFQTFTLLPGQEFLVDVQWDNFFLEGGGQGSTVNTQINVFITDGAGTQFFEGGTSANQQNSNALNTQEAMQLIDFVNPLSSPAQFALEFQLAPGSPAPTMLRWVDVASNLITGPPIGLADPGALGEGGPASFGHETAAGAVTVAAVPWYNPAATEPFSAVGGRIPILFDTAGNRLATPDIRQKPDVSGTDGVDTSFFVDIPAATGDPDQHDRFFGTSAAAPHVAAGATLLLQKYGRTSPDQLLQYMEQTAIPVNGPPWNPRGGFGLVQIVPQTTTGPIPPFVTFGETSNTATPLGVLNGGEAFRGQIADLPNGLPSNQWAEWTAGKAGTFMANITYGIISGDLHFRLYTLDSAGDLLELASGTNIAVLGQNLSATVTKGEPLLLWIYGFNHAQGPFTLHVNLV
jgi:hypothetical protein